jgi:hypothetical protein
LTPAESLVSFIIKTDALLRRKDQTSPARFRPSQRVWIEPFFNGIGHSVGQLLFLLPAPWRRRAHIWMCGQMAQHAPEAFLEQARYQSEAVARAQSLYKRTGHWPAVLFLTSHPETVGPLAWLRFELLRQALWIADALERASPNANLRSHPQCFLAIDPFALDSVPVPVSGMYAGIMHSQYLVWDRQSSTQSWLQKHGLLAGTGHDRIAWRLLKALPHNPLLMVLAGGMPANARLFYAAREWAGTLKDATHTLSKHRIRYRIMEILSTEINGQWPTETGIIPPTVEEKISAFLSALGYSIPDRQALLETLKADFKLEVPMRLRLWNVLSARLAQRGVPLLVLPLSHQKEAPHIRLGSFFEMTAETDPVRFAKDIHAFYASDVDKIAP